MAAKLQPKSMNHVAYQTLDPQATHTFWTEVIGLEYVGGLLYDGSHAVSNGDTPPPFIHTFYAMPNGSCIAFFDVSGAPEKKDDGWPNWTRHIALNCSSYEELQQWREHFDTMGVPYDGEINHQNGMFLSYYVNDPNGIRIEITYMPNPLTEEDRLEGIANLESWLADKAAGKV